MTHQKSVADLPYSPATRYGRSRAFDALSQILVVLMEAALILFGLWLSPPELDSLISETLGWCIAVVAVVVAAIAALGLFERLTVSDPSCRRAPFRPHVPHEPFPKLFSSFKEPHVDIPAQEQQQLEKHGGRSRQENTAG